LVIFIDIIEATADYWHYLLLIITDYHYFITDVHIRPSVLSEDYFYVHGVV
jgi:hypothetical protein